MAQPGPRHSIASGWPGWGQDGVACLAETGGTGILLPASHQGGRGWVWRPEHESQTHFYWMWDLQQVPSLGHLSELVRWWALGGHDGVDHTGLFSPHYHLLCIEDFSRRYLLTKDLSYQKKMFINWVISRFTFGSKNQQAGLGSVS